MQRLAACAGLQSNESDAVSRALLATSSLVGRNDVLSQLRSKLVNARVLRGGGVVIDGPAGIGRSRVLDACVLDAKTLGFTVLHATASGTREAFASERALLTHLLAAHDYELLPLRFVVDAAAALAGVAVVATLADLPRTQRQIDLLHALASTLMQTGDSSGLRLTDAA
jgi:hypothetical protein